MDFFGPNFSKTHLTISRTRSATFFECICPHGFTGPLCETVPVEMNCGEGGGCRNGGQCRKVPKGQIVQSLTKKKAIRKNKTNIML